MSKFKIPNPKSKAQNKFQASIPKHLNFCQGVIPSMKREIVKIKDVAPAPGPFNHIVKAGNFLFFSSQLSVDLKSNTILKGNIQEQTKQALENVKFLLKSAGYSMGHIVKVAVYMKDVKKDFQGMNEIYRQYFKTGNEPARVTVQALSPIEGIDIEIEVVAIVD